MRLLLVLIACVVLPAAEHGEVISVLGPDRLVIQYYQLPVVVRLAELEIPAATADAAQAKLVAMAAGKRSNVSWGQDLGADEAGTPRVYVAIGSEAKSLNEVLVEAGLARTRLLGEGGRNRERLVAAEAKARKAKAGLWADAPAVSAPAAPAAPAAAPVVAAAKGPFCAEIEGRNYFPSDTPEAARLNPKRMVYYASAAAAKKAGKQPWQASAPGSVATIEEARAAITRGKAMLTQAAGQAPTPERDQLYERAFLELSSAMQVLSRLAEASPNDDKLGEELQQCMQMRYSAMKSKRYSK